LTQLSLACGLALDLIGDQTLVNQAAHGMGLWFLRDDYGSEKARWTMAFERAEKAEVIDNADRWIEAGGSEEIQTAWGHVLVRAEPRIATIRMPGHRALGYLVHLAAGAMMRREGKLQAHAAALSPGAGQRAALIAGASGAGKTMLTLNLAHRGWRFLSDDSVALDQDRDGVGAVPIRKHFMQGDCESRRKRSLDPEVMFPGQRLWGRTQIGALVFPERANAESCSLSAISKAQTVARLLCTTAGLDQGSERRRMSLLSRLALLPSFVLYSGTDVLSGGPSAEAALLRCLPSSLPA
jgi:hypothetical protein